MIKFNDDGSILLENIEDILDFYVAVRFICLCYRCCSSVLLRRNFDQMEDSFDVS